MLFHHFQNKSICSNTSLSMGFFSLLFNIRTTQNKKNTTRKKNSNVTNEAFYRFVNIWIQEYICFNFIGFTSFFFSFIEISIESVVNAIKLKFLWFSPSCRTQTNQQYRLTRVLFFAVDAFSDVFQLFFMIAIEIKSMINMWFASFFDKNRKKCSTRNHFLIADALLSFGFPFIKMSRI